MKAKLRCGCGCGCVWPDDLTGGAPVVRQQRLQVAVLERGQTLEHILEIGTGIVTVEFGRLDQAQDHSRSLAGLL